MKALFTAAFTPHDKTYLPLLKQLAKQDRFGVHGLTDDPLEADVIIFVDAHQTDFRLKAIRAHPFVSAYREKTFLYHESDQPWCALPGLYVSMPRRDFNPQRQRAFSYIWPGFNPYTGSECRRDIAPDLLFSFMGRQCHGVRHRILALSHPRAHIEDTSRYNFFGSADTSIDDQRRRYADVVARSKFVLCPRGAGPASFRLFETMAMGRVPVILSDEWVPPFGPRWSELALRVPESEADALPSLIEAAEDRYETMARLARQDWEQWFAPDVLFHRMVEGCKDILDKRRIPEAFWQRLPDRRRLRLQARVAKAHIAARLRKRPL